MPGQVQAQGFFLPTQPLLERDLFGAAMVRVDIGVGFDEQAAEEIGMAAVVTARGLLGRLNGFFECGQQDAAVAVDVGLILFRLVVEKRPQTVQRPAANQAVEGALVDALEVDAGAEIEQVGERAFLTRFSDGFHRAFADALDRAEAIDDAAVVVHGELEFRVVHVRRIKAQLHDPHFFDQGHDLVGVVHVR